MPRTTLRQEDDFYVAWRACPIALSC